MKILNKAVNENLEKVFRKDTEVEDGESRYLASEERAARSYWDSVIQW